MIGIKVQNLAWEKALLELLGASGEKYQENRTYDLVISDQKTSEKSLILGKDITLPFRFESLKNKMN